MARRLTRSPACRALCFKQVAAVFLGDEEVEEDLALRAQEPGMNRGRDAEQRHVVGDNALQELAGIVASHRDDAAVG